MVFVFPIPINCCQAIKQVMKMTFIENYSEKRNINESLTASALKNEVCFYYSFTSRVMNACQIFNS